METARRVILKDSTLREGLDVPGVTLTASQKGELVDRLLAVGLPEVELVSPGRFAHDLNDLRQIGHPGRGIRYSGLVYGFGPAWREQIERAAELLDRQDVLLPLSGLRPPFEPQEKLQRMEEILATVAGMGVEVGVGFPHTTQVESQFLVRMCQQAGRAGAKRITLYDTNGSADPWTVGNLVRAVRQETAAEICFHAHNDLGLATANALAAVRAGADCLDVTVNGLGDRAGNASLEQVALALHLQGMAHGLRLDLLKDLSRTVATLTGIPVPKLAPVVGEFVFLHKSPGHLPRPELFEPFDPTLVGAVRGLCDK